MMSNILLSLKNLTAAYGGSDVISNISFDMKSGEIIGIVGESGSGKSTLLKTIFPLQEFGVIQSDGEVQFQGKDMATLTEFEKKRLRGEQMGMIFQNPKAAFNPVRSYKKQFIETLKSHGCYNKNTFQQQVFEIFEKLKLTDGKRILNSCPFELSGGMNQRMAIALAVLLQPVLLLADEPTSALDITAQEQVMEELLRIRELYHTSVLIVSHNIGAVARLADKIGVMYQGNLIEFGTTMEVLSHPKSPYTRRLLAAVPQIKDISDKKTCTSSECLLRLSRVSKEYKGFNTTFSALKTMDLQVTAGEILGIAGESGSGKSTLLHLIGGLCRPTKGTIVFKGRDITLTRKKEDYKDMQMIFQNSFEAFNPRRSIRSSIGEALKNLCDIKNRKDLDNRIALLMKRVGLDVKLANRYPWELSGGQCQRAAIARAICAEPDLLLCDEITSALDVSVQSEIIKLLLELHRSLGMAIIFVSHDIALISSICEHIMVIQDGACMEYGTTTEVITNPKTDYTKRLVTYSLHSKGAAEIGTY